MRDGIYSPELRDNKDGVLHDPTQKFPEFTVLGVDFDTKLLCEELARTITFVLMDSSGDVFRAQTSTGLTSIMEDDDGSRIEPGCTLVVHRYEWIRLVPDPTLRGFMFIHGAKWLESPTEQDHASCFGMPHAQKRITDPDLESLGSDEDDCELVEVWCECNFIDKRLISVCFEHSLILETRFGSDPDPASMDCRKIDTSVITYNDDFFVNLYCYRNEGNGKKRCKVNAKENVPRIPTSCNCVTDYGYALCVGSAFPPRAVHVKSLYYEIGHKYRQPNIKKIFASLPVTKKRMCLYWWFGMNFFNEKALDDTVPGLGLPPCLVALIDEDLPHEKKTNLSLTY